MATAAAIDRPGIPRAPARRRFRLLDGMILVAATALGCALGEWIARQSRGQISWWELADVFQGLVSRCSSRDWSAVVERTVDFVLLIAGLTMPFAAIWTLALFPLRLLGPRPRFRRMTKQPGLTATCAASAAIALIALFALVAAMEAALGAPTILDGVVDMAPFLAPMLVGWTVAVAWTTLLVGRRWRAEPSWIDRLGRIVGVFWIVVGFAITCVFFIDPLVRTYSFPGNGKPTTVINAGGDGAESPPGL